MQISASSYADFAAAQRAVDDVIAASQNQTKIGRWLDLGAKRFLPLEGHVSGEVVGVVLTDARGAFANVSRATNYAKALLGADPTLESGYTVLTTYPIADVDPPDIDAVYPQLYDLVGGYYHQDWYDHFHGSPQAALDAFVASSTTFQIAETIAELDRLFATTRDQSAFDRLLRRLDNNYRFDRDAGLSPGLWFETIRTRFRRA